MPSDDNHYYLPAYYPLPTLPGLQIAHTPGNVSAWNVPSPRPAESTRTQSLDSSWLRAVLGPPDDWFSADGEEHVGTVATRSAPTHVSSSRSLSSPEMVDSRPRSRSSPHSEQSEATPNIAIEYECRRSIESLLAASSVANLADVTAGSHGGRDTPVQNHRVDKHKPAGRLRESVPLIESKYYKRESDDEDTLEYANLDDDNGDNDPRDDDIVDYENVEDDNGDNDLSDEDTVNYENVEDDNGDNDLSDEDTVDYENVKDDNGDNDLGDEVTVEYENVLDDGHNDHSDDETIESENDEDDNAKGGTGSDAPTPEDNGLEDNGEDDDLEELNNEDNGDNHNSLEVDHEDNTPMDIPQPVLRRSKRLNAALEQTDGFDHHGPKETSKNTPKSVQNSRRGNARSAGVAAPSVGSSTDGLPDIYNRKVEIERILTTQRSGGKLWLKIKWKGIPTGSWELADYMRSELGDKDYQELLETKPRKRRKKGPAW